MKKEELSPIAKKIIEKLNSKKGFRFWFLGLSKKDRQLFRNEVEIELFALEANEEIDKANSN